MEELSSVSTQHEIPQTESASELLPLDARERVCVFRSGGRSCRHIFRRITSAHWELFFAHVVAEFQQQKSGYMQVVDSNYAMLVLYSKVILRVEGYETPDGIEPNKLPDWPECVPQEHRLPSIELLMRMSRTEAENRFMLQSGGKRVQVDATWNEAEPGNMKVYRGLVHKFATPKQEHRRRFLKTRSRAFIAGGSRTATTVIPSAYPSLVKLYDDLVESVEGYSIAGRPLETRDEIAREMDGFHKTVAVSRLFQTSGGVDEETEASTPVAE